MTADSVHQFSERANYEPEVNVARNWVTHPGAEFINSLCPNREMTAFPKFEGLLSTEFDHLKDAFRYGFNSVQAYYRSTLMERHYLGRPNAAELRTLHVIDRKTFQFGKLMEKIPRRVFVEGEQNREGQLVRDRIYDTVVVPPSGMSDSAFNKGVNGLVSKGLIGKVASDPHPRFGESSVYCALPPREAVQILFDRAFSEFKRIYRVRADEVSSLVWDEINLRCSALCGEADAEMERARTLMEQQNERKAERTLQRVAIAVDGS